MADEWCLAGQSEAPHRGVRQRIETITRRHAFPIKFHSSCTALWVCFLVEVVPSVVLFRCVT